MSGFISILDINVLFKGTSSEQYRNYVFRIIIKTQRDFIVLTYWCYFSLVLGDTKIFITKGSNDMKKLSPDLFRYPSFIQVKHRTDIDLNNLLADLEKKGYVLRKYKSSCAVFILESMLCSIYEAKYELEQTLGTDELTYYYADMRPINRIFLNNIIEIGGIKYKAKVSKGKVKFEVV